MIRAKGFVRELKNAGFELFTGVPCSMFKPLLAAVQQTPDIRFVNAVNEGDAVAMACGAELGGRRSVVLFQNSGLGNAVNPLTSLAYPFRIPVLLLVSWRGQPEMTLDEPQHRLMGSITTDMLELMRIPWEIMPSNDDDISAAVQRAVRHMDRHGMPYALVIERKTFEKIESVQNNLLEDVCLHPEVQSNSLLSNRFPQDEILETIQRNATQDDILLTTTGYTGRALFALNDLPNQLYMCGSMGCAPALALGLALTRPDKRVIVIDGDGALLMRMGSLATIGHEQPENLVHILLDNGAYDSTGGQETVAPTTDFSSIARACGYPEARCIGDPAEITRVLESWNSQLNFMHVKTYPRQQRKLPRPDIAPYQVANRLRQWLEVTTWEHLKEHAC